MKKMSRGVTADIVYTGNSQAIENGTVEFANDGSIEHIGKNASGKIEKIEKLDGIICPGFVNAHCHLELSHLENKLQSKTGLHSFIQNLQKQREAPISAINYAMQNADNKLRQNGVVAVGDISNSNLSFGIKKTSDIHYHTFIELFGFDKHKSDAIHKKGMALREELKQLQLSGNTTPHSPYSVSENLMKAISSEKTNLPLSIHNQETEEENRMFLNREGKMIEMLESFQLDISNWEHSKTSSIKSYLPHFPINRKLLLVHNTYTTEEDMKWAESLHQNLYWCFCPKANLFIEGRLPQIDNFYKMGLKCTLGTDSLASNDSLSILEEMQCIQKNYPEIPLQELIKWSSWNAAEFLGIEAQFGSIEIGKKPALLHIQFEEEGKLDGAVLSRII